MNIDLDAIQARADAPTKGPWRTEVVETGRFAGIESRVYAARGTHILLSANDGEAGQAVTTNAEFIAHARTDVPALLALVREQAAKLEAVRELADDASSQPGSELAPVKAIGGLIRAALGDAS